MESSLLVTSLGHTGLGVIAGKPHHLLYYRKNRRQAQAKSLRIEFFIRILEQDMCTLTVCRQRDVVDITKP